MLLKFKFKNYKSFKDEVCLDLTATKITEFSERNFKVANIKVLPVASIFGANASGKSNVMEALKFMVDYIMFSLNFAGAQVNPNLQLTAMKPIPFLFNDKLCIEGTTFELYFVVNTDTTEKIYQYGFVIKGNVVEEEWLNYKAKTSRESFKTIFYRSQIKNDENDFSGLDKDIVKNIEVSMQKETLILTLGSKLKEKTLSEIFNWFNTIININFGNEIETHQLYAMTGMLRRLLNNDVQKGITKYLASFDSNIKNVKAIEKEIDSITKQKIIDIYLTHDIEESNRTTDIPLKYESAGTQKMFHLYPYLDSVLTIGGILFLDELNSKLHPLLVRVIIQMFLNKDINKNCAQLVFTSHDVWQLKSDILRRDEIWFTEKNDKGISNLYSLSDFIDEDGEKIRKDEDYQKNYILGKYGAIPKLKGFEGVFN